MQPPSCRRRLSYGQTSFTSRQLTFLAVVHGSLALVLSSSLVDLRADKCCCPSRTPQRRGNRKGRGTPENVARLAALFHVLERGVAGSRSIPHCSPTACDLRRGRAAPCAVRAQISYRDVGPSATAC